MSPTEETPRTPSLRDSVAAWAAQSVPDPDLQRVFEALGRGTPGERQYEVKDEVGQGGMATVYRIWDGTLRRELAMKVVHRPGAGQRENPGAETRRLARFLEEAQITGQLEHPGIVPVHEIGLTPDGQLFFTMRLVRGHSFREVLRWVREGQEGWNQTRALGVLLAVCEAVAFAHSRGVVHRDLKPDNVMVGRFGETYVMDWGLARVVGREDRRDQQPDPSAPPAELSIDTERRDARRASADSPLLTMDGAVVGTPSYMPPEQARGQASRLGPASDVYSIGAMLYHLLTGQMPYVTPGSRITPHTILAMVLAGPPRPLHEVAPGVPAELVAICDKAMSREGKDRYRDTQEMAQDIRAYLEQRVVQAYETGTFAELKKWVLRNRAWAASLAGLLVTIIALLGLVAFTRERARAQAAEGERVAREAQGLAAARLEDVMRLADLKALQDLESEAAALWPIDPALVPRLQAWIDRARRLVDSLPQHRRSLAELRAQGTAVPGDPPAWSFATPAQAWWHDTLAGLVDRLERFAAPDARAGTLASVSDRLQRAATLEERSLLRHDAQWQEVLTEIFLEERYGEFDPQMGLVPLGRDPHSGLWEFHHVETGAPPVRDPQTGALRIAADTGLVLVLVPGGRFVMGAQSRDSGEPSFDPHTLSSERDHEVELEAFFLSRHEMTQTQWERLTGANPSHFHPGYPGIDDGELHPVEQVSWEDCDAALLRVGLVLPTEAQWEYAARGDTDTPWWTGEDRLDLRGAANLADQSYARGFTNPQPSEAWDDGYPAHAAVNLLRPNPFGLHHVLGNVWEWCADWYVDYEVAPRPGDGLRVPAPGTDPPGKVARGGGFAGNTAQARCAVRDYRSPAYRSFVLGVRPARAIQR